MTTPDTVEDLRILGNREFNVGNYTAAIKHFTEAIALDPSNHIIFSNRSACYAAMHQPVLALADAERSCELAPDWAKSWNRKATALQMLGRWEEGLKAWGKVIELEPRNDTAKRSMQACLQGFVQSFQQQQNASASAFEPTEPQKPEPESEPTNQTKEAEEELPDDKKEAERLKQLGTTEYKKRNFEQAMKYYEEAAALQPTNMTYLLNQSAVQFEEEKYEECIAKCTEALEVGRSNHAEYALMAKAYARMGNAHEKLGRIPEAITYLQKSLTENRTADVQQKLKTLEKTLAEEQRRSRQDPKAAEKERERGNELFKAGKYAEAVQAYTEAITRAEDDPRAYANRAACYLKLAAVSEGVKDCESAIKLDPKFIKAYTRKAALLLLKKDYAECLEVCDKVSEMAEGAAVKAEMEGYRVKALMGMQGGSTSGAEGMRDPEVQEILADPVMQQILQQMQQDPKAIMEHLRNPTIAAKMRKLVSAGIVRMSPNQQ